MDEEQLGHVSVSKLVVIFLPHCKQKPRMVHTSARCTRKGHYQRCFRSHQTKHTLMTSVLEGSSYQRTLPCDNRPLLGRRLASPNTPDELGARRQPQKYENENRGPFTQSNHQPQHIIHFCTSLVARPCFSMTTNRCRKIVNGELAPPKPTSLCSWKFHTCCPTTS